MRVGGRQLTTRGASNVQNVRSHHVQIAVPLHCNMLDLCHVPTYRAIFLSSASSFI